MRQLIVMCFILLVACGTPPKDQFIIIPKIHISSCSYGRLTGLDDTGKLFTFNLLYNFDNGIQAPGCASWNLSTWWKIQYLHKSSGYNGFVAAETVK